MSIVHYYSYLQYPHTNDHIPSTTPNMPSTPPRTKEDLLATGTLSQEYIDAQKASNRSTDFPDDLEIVKEGAMAMLPYTQKALADSRPEDVDEKEIHVPLSTGFTSRCIILSPKQAPAASPLIVLFYGGK